MTCNYPDLSRASDWLKQISHAVRPLRGTTLIWVMSRHQSQGERGGVYSVFQATGMIEGVFRVWNFRLRDFLLRKILAGIFLGIQNNLKIRDGSLVSGLRSSPGNFYGSEIRHAIFWGLRFGPRNFGGFVSSPMPHSIIPVIWNPEYPRAIRMEWWNICARFTDVISRGNKV